MNERGGQISGRTELRRRFLAKGHPEGHYLDYKVALSGESEREQRREFLKDVTGFANALGGNIIIGATEPAEGLAVDQQLKGIADGDKVAQALENVSLPHSSSPSRSRVRSESLRYQRQ